MRHFDPDELRSRYQFRLPQFAFWAIAGFTAVRFWGYLAITQPWFEPIVQAVWGIWLALVLLLCLYCWQRNRSGEQPIDEGAAKLLLLLAVVLIALVTGARLGMQHLGG